MFLDIAPKQTMEMYLKNSETWNLIKALLANDATREGLLDFVSIETSKFQNKTLSDIRIKNKLKENAVCSVCLTPTLLKCPTENVCKNKQDKKHDTCMYHIEHKFNPANCRQRICSDFLKAIEDNHRLSKPSWRNTHAEKWCSNAWEIGKCYCPPTGYAHQDSIQDTDFAGVVSVIINAKFFIRCVGQGQKFEKVSCFFF